MHRYNSREYDPPAPVISIEISNPSNKRQNYQEKALLDTGADFTCIPSDVLNNLTLVKMREVRLAGYEEKDFEVKSTYSINLKFNGFEDITEVVAIDSGSPIIGRDILNKLELILDGKKLQFDIK